MSFLTGFVAVEGTEDFTDFLKASKHSCSGVMQLKQCRPPDHAHISMCLRISQSVCIISFSVSIFMTAMRRAGWFSSSFGCDFHMTNTEIFPEPHLSDQVGLKFFIGNIPNTFTSSSGKPGMKNISVISTTSVNTEIKCSSTTTLLPWCPVYKFRL